MRARSGTRTTLRLEGFVPFRLNRLAAGVSGHLAEVYRGPLALEVPAWRVLATVGERGRCTAQQIVASTRMHKTRVSRAIAQLLERRLIARLPSPGDRRERPLRLTGAGQRMYARLVPLALARERALLRCMRRGELRGFLRGIGRLEAFLGLKNR